MRLKMYLLLLSVIVFFTPSSVLAETSKNLAVFYELEGDVTEKYNNMVETSFETIGFNLTDPHKRVNDQYKAKYGSTVLDVLSFMSIVNDEKLMPLLNIDPRIAGFAPFNMLIHKSLDEKTTHIGHLLPEVMLDIIGIEDKKLRKDFIASFEPLDAMIEKEMGGKKSYMPYTKLTSDSMLNFEFEFERPEDIDDFIEEFQNTFEMSFINKDYLIAGFHNFMETTDDAEEVLKGYDLFWTYSLCHLEYSYNMFDNKGGYPEAGLFAPCSMYVYVRKDSNKMVIGMPRLVNWSDTLGITDEKRLGLVHKLDKEIPEILTALGMKAVTNVNPLVETPQPYVAKVEAAKEVKVTTAPVESKKEEEIIVPDSRNIMVSIPTPSKVPTVIKVETVNNNSYDINNRSIKFSKRVPPNYTGPKFGKKFEAPKVDNTAKVGEVNAGRIATYLRGELMTQEEVEKTLKSAGFSIITSTVLDKKGKLVSVVFTNKALTTMASKANRGFASTLRVLINKKEKEISIVNPLYMLKAFLQTDFDEAGAKELLTTLTSSFKGLKDSEDMLKYQLLPTYQFMSGLPHYEDMEMIGQGSDLIEKLQNNKRVLFIHKLDNGSTLIGVKLAKRTNKFTKRIGTNNSAMLPYPVLIENGKAWMLEPKYYISIMYPKLTMTQFMTIATTPGAMIKDCTKVFR